MTIKKQAKCCSLELATICLFGFGVLFAAVWHEYAPEPREVRPGEEIMVEMRGYDETHDATCGHHVDVRKERRHIVEVLRKGGY